jgi:hypothetical protein
VSPSTRFPDTPYPIVKDNSLSFVIVLPCDSVSSLGMTANRGDKPVIRKKVNELFEDWRPTLRTGDIVFIHETRARIDFSMARYDAVTLLRIHDRETGRKSGRPKPELEALKRSALILSVTAWESFVEDTVTEQLDKLLKRTNDPVAISHVFNHIADEWLNRTGNGARRAPDLIKWTADHWKDLIRESLRKSLVSFNTPGSEQVAKLFKKYLDKDVSKTWAWHGVTSAAAREQLDQLIKLRGEVVHKGRKLHPFSEPHAIVRRSQVIQALNLIYNLVFATERGLGVAPTYSVTSDL